jgi:hypothetical protein
MTPQEQEIIDAIWGKDVTEADKIEAKQVVKDIFAMAELMKARMEAGKIAIIPITDWLH